MLNLCITCSSSRVVPSMVNLIKKIHPDWRIIGIDLIKDDLCKFYLDEFYTVSLPIKNNYVEEILEIVKNELINYILVLSDDEASVLSESNMRSKLENLGCKVLLPDNYVINICNDKANLFNKFNESNLLQEEYYLVNNKEDLEYAALKLNYPEKSFILKPRFGRGSRGFCLVDKNVKLREYFLGSKNNKFNLDTLINGLVDDNNLNLIATAFYPGKDYNIDVMTYKGELCYSLIQERVQPKFGPILKAKISNDFDIFQILKEVVSLLNFTGLINIEMARRKEDDLPRIYEINPRPSAAFSFLYYQDVDPLNDLIKCVNHEKPPFRLFKEMIIQRFWDQLYDYEN
tara:strand:+ start:678 stop:1712 length:1035 start_codon:yes stop_codon:yes gene_type:complete